jgi:hypothetical protein
MSRISLLVQKTVKAFCQEFLRTPYLCYTEHGIHARFYAQILAAIPEDKRVLGFGGQTVCVVQKEYPTAHDLKKTRRQHWDIAVLANPAVPKFGETPPYDFLKLDSVVEFGMNATPRHLKEDIRRLGHPEANVDNQFIVHLHRLSTPGTGRISSRDWSPRSKQILDGDDVRKMLRGTRVIVYFGVADVTGKRGSSLTEVTQEYVKSIRW